VSKYIAVMNCGGGNQLVNVHLDHGEEKKKIAK
jgi:hypothetical protein